VAKKDWVGPVTVVALTLDSPIQVGSIIGDVRESINVDPGYGEVISSEAALALSSRSPQNRDADHGLLFSEKGSPRGFAFQTGKELNPWATIDLGAEHLVSAVHIVNRAGDKQNRGLILSSSEDGGTWTRIWQAATREKEWIVPVTRFHAGLDVPGRSARYLKLEVKHNSPRSFQLHRVTVFGKK